MDPSHGSPRTPMSERQQLALIRCMESKSQPESSPPRTPLRSLQNRGTDEEAKTPKTPAEERLRRKLCKKNSKGETPLHAAAIKGRASLVRRLLALGASPNVKDNAGWSPLHEAANRGNLKVTRILLRYGADVNSLGDGQETPLHDAARNGHIQVVEYLVGSGAALGAVNASGLTPLEVASHPENRVRHPGLRSSIEYLRRSSSLSSEAREEEQFLLRDALLEESSSGSSLDSGEEGEGESSSRLLGNEDLLLHLVKRRRPKQTRDMKKALIKQQQQQQQGTAAASGSHPGSPREHHLTPASASGNAGGVDLSRLTVRLSASFPEGQSPHPTPPSSSIKTRLTYGMEDNTGMTHQGSNASNPSSTSHPSNHSSHTNTANNTTTAKEDVYEFKASKDAPSNTTSRVEDLKAHEAGEGSAAGSSSSGASGPHETTSTGAEKRPFAPGEESSNSSSCSEEDHRARKKAKKEEIASASSTNKVGRCSRGNSMEKVSPKTRSALSSSDGSPKSKEEFEGAEEEGGGPEESGSKNSFSDLKVPPLKIVLSGNNNANSNTNSGGSAGNSVGEASLGKDGGGGPSPGLDKKSGRYLLNNNNKEEGGNGGHPNSGGSNSCRSIMSGSYGHHEEGKTEESSEGGGDSQHPGMLGGALTEKGGRMTRSKAHQGGGNPGPEGPGESQGASSSSDQAATDSSDNKNPSSSDYSFKKRKLRSQVVDDSNNRAGNNNNNNGSSNSSQNNNNSGSGNYSGGNNGLLSSNSSNHPCGNANGNANSGGGSNNLSGNDGGSNSGGGPGNNLLSEPMNDIEKFLNIRKQIEQRRKNLFPVQPKPPQGFKDYLMNRKSYLLQENASERLRQIPLIQPPPSLEGAMMELFKEQEEARRKLRMKHVVEKEKLVLSVEQEILRVHGRAARALANQSSPYSLCTILRDEEIYTPIDPQQEEKNRDIRSRYNGRLFLSWLQDVDDKWERIKEQMVLRHHNEAESLNAVQKMDWEWKLKEISDNPSSALNDSIKPQIDDLLIPMVHVSDEFGLTDCRN